MAHVSCPVTMLRGVPVIAAPGEIDAGNAGSLRAVLAETAARGHATIVVDLTATQFCDSAGLHVLIRAHRMAVAEGGELRLVIGSGAVLRTFAITGVDRVMPRFPDRAAAVAPLPAVTIDPAWLSWPGIVSAA
ncbi:MAG TPA: STAS domain-containing protein [Streptosporangiaceae bacterium]|nr:STAS domain-containing protein [Streptosporangiaceae bacterium]